MLGADYVGDLVKVTRNTQNMVRLTRTKPPTSFRLFALKKDKQKQEVYSGLASLREKSDNFIL